MKDIEKAFEEYRLIGNEGCDFVVTSLDDERCDIMDWGIHDGVYRKTVYAHVLYEEYVYFVRYDWFDDEMKLSHICPAYKYQKGTKKFKVRNNPKNIFPTAENKELIDNVLAQPHYYRVSPEHRVLKHAPWWPYEPDFIPKSSQNVGS